MFNLVDWKAVPRTNIGETFYGSSETALRESISALGADPDAYAYFKVNWKMCPSCNRETETFASDVIVGGEDVCADCFRNQQQKAE